MKFTYLLIVLVIFILPHYAWADVPLTYKKANNYKETKIISYVATLEGNESDYLVAAVDLNNDFIEEYIVTLNNCKKATLCPFTILAYMNKAPTEIGRFQAHKIIITDVKNFGIKQLRIYNKSSNDFAQQAAVWNPYEFKYVYK